MLCSIIHNRGPVMNRCLLILAALALWMPPSLAEQAPVFFPPRVGGMKRTFIQSYEGRAPGLGFSVRYILGERWADVYLYDKGFKTLRHGDAAAAAAERDAAVDDIEGMAKRGDYRSAKIESKGAATLRATTFATARATVVVKESAARFVCSTRRSGEGISSRSGCRRRPGRTPPPARMLSSPPLPPRSAEAACGPAHCRGGPRGKEGHTPRRTRP